MYTYALIFVLNAATMTTIDQVDKATCEYNMQKISDTYNKIHVLHRPDVKLFCIPKDRKNV